MNKYNLYFSCPWAPPWPPPHGPPPGPPHGPVIAPHGPVIAPHGPVIAPHGPVIAPCGPVIAPCGPVIAPCGPVIAYFMQQYRSLTPKQSILFYYYSSLEGGSGFFKGFPCYFRDVFLVKQVLDLETCTTWPRTKTFSVLPGNPNLYRTINFLKRLRIKLFEKYEIKQYILSPTFKTFLCLDLNHTRKGQSCWTLKESYESQSWLGLRQLEWQENFLSKYIHLFNLYKRI